MLPRVPMCSWVVLGDPMVVLWGPLGVLSRVLWGPLGSFRVLWGPLGSFGVISRTLPVFTRSMEGTHG